MMTKLGKLSGELVLAFPLTNIWHSKAGSKNEVNILHEKRSDLNTAK